MDDGRETQHRDQRRADGDADLAPAQRRAHDQAVVIESRYQGRTSCRGGIPVLCAPPLKLERVRLCLKHASAAYLGALPPPCGGGVSAIAAADG